MPEIDPQQAFAPKHAPAGTHEHERDADHGHDHPHDLASTLGNTNVGRVLHGTGVQRAGATSAQQLDESVARAIEDRRGRGRPLEDATRTDMEQSLGHDLSGVRVHTDSDAHSLNEAVGARAFTTGSDVFFKSGTYDPGSSSGRELLAHELTHVVQQRSGTSGLDAGQVSHPSDSAEVEAAQVGQAVASQAPASPMPTAATAGVARVDEEEEALQGAFESATGVARMGTEEDEELQMAVDPARPAISREGEEEEELG